MSSRLAIVGDGVLFIRIDQVTPRDCQMTSAQWSNGCPSRNLCRHVSVDWSVLPLCFEGAARLVPIWRLRSVINLIIHHTYSPSNRPACSLQRIAVQKIVSAGVDRGNWLLEFCSWPLVARCLLKLSGRWWSSGGKGTGWGITCCYILCQWARPATALFLLAIA